MQHRQIGSYNGPVTIVGPSGDEWTAKARLVKRQAFDRSGDGEIAGLESWSGWVAGDVDWFSFHGETATLRTRDGRAGHFLATSSDAASVNGQAQIKGSGPAPF
jgi:hypothetical protein